jgi:hypothetical protein
VARTKKKLETRKVKKLETRKVSQAQDGLTCEPSQIFKLIGPVNRVELCQIDQTVE